MCGRFAMYAPASSIAEVFGLDLPDIPEVPARYNLAPTDPVLGIRVQGGTRVGGVYRWGLVPWWAEDKKVGARWINARSEDVGKTRVFREPFAQRRLVVPASGFYEWRLEAGRKQAYFFRRADGRPMAFAGLWDRWRPRAAREEDAGPRFTASAAAREEDAGPRLTAPAAVSDEVVSCTILTTRAAEVVEPVHDRMPVVLAERDLERWLDPGVEDPEVLRDLLVPREGLEVVRVGPRVNKAGNEGADLVEAVPSPPPSLFDR